MAINLTPIIDAVETALETEFAGTTLVFGVQAPTPANGSESVWVAVEFANYDYAATGIIYGLLTVNCFSHLGLSQATDLGDRAKDTLDGLTLAGVKADPATTPRQVTRAGSLYQVNTVVRFTVQGLTLTAFSPTQGKVGDAITIYGTGFTGATSASINGVAIGSFVVVSDGVITGVVGNATTTGKVSVTAPSGTGESLTDFVIITGDVEWGNISGNLYDNSTLWEALKQKADKKQLAKLNNLMNTMTEPVDSLTATQKAVLTLITMRGY